ADLAERGLELADRLADRQRDLRKLLAVREEDLLRIEETDRAHGKRARIAGHAPLGRDLETEAVVASELGAEEELAARVARGQRERAPELEHVAQCRAAGRA